MSNDFDIEKARAGEQVEHKVNLSGNWELAHFVGVLIDGTPVIQIGRNVFACDEAYLRMAPKKIKVRYRPYAFINSSHKRVDVGVATHELDVPELESSSNFVKWLTDWQEAEVEQ